MYVDSTFYWSRNIDDPAILEQSACLKVKNVVLNMYNFLT